MPGVDGFVRCGRLCQVWTVVSSVDGCVKCERLCQVQTECVRCGLNATDLDWMCQVWTASVRCGLEKSGLDCMCQVWTGKVRCGQDVSGVGWICKHTDKTSAVRQKAAANVIGQKESHFIPSECTTHPPERERRSK